MSVSIANAQQTSIATTIDAFPYQHKSEATTSIKAMQSWQKKEWKQLVKLLNDDSLKLKSSYALNAFIHEASLDPVIKHQTAIILASLYSEATTFYAKELLIKQLSLLGDDAALKLLTSL